MPYSSRAACRPSALAPAHTANEGGAVGARSPCAAQTLGRRQCFDHRFYRLLTREGTTLSPAPTPLFMLEMGATYLILFWASSAILPSPISGPPNLIPIYGWNVCDIYHNLKFVTYLLQL